MICSVFIVLKGSNFKVWAMKIHEVFENRIFLFELL